MQITYIPSSNTATNGVALGTDTNADVRLMKLIIGAPVASGNITIYSITNPVNGASTNIAAKLTFPASLPTTGAEVGGVVKDFGPYGLPLNQGGNIIIDQTMQVTAIWELAESLDLR